MYSYTSPVMKVRASQGMKPSSKKILRLSRAHSLSESLNSYCVRVEKKPYVDFQTGRRPRKTEQVSLLMVV